MPLTRKALTKALLRMTDNLPAKILTNAILLSNIALSTYCITLHHSPLVLCLNTLFALPTLYLLNKLFKFKILPAKHAEILSEEAFDSIKIISQNKSEDLEL
jgi:hypothetical protein